MRRRGFSVVEILVVAVLLSIILTITVSFLVPAFHAWHQADQRATLEQSGTVAVSFIGRDLSQSAISSVQIMSDSTFDTALNATTEIDAISFLSVADADDHVAYDMYNVGNPIYQKFVCYYVDTDWNLVRWCGHLPGQPTFANWLRLQFNNDHARPPTATVVMMTPSPDPTSALVPSNVIPTSDSRVVARCVHRFQCSVATHMLALGQKTPVNPVHVNLLLKDATYEYPVETDVVSILSH